MSQLLEGQEFSTLLLYYLKNITSMIVIANMFSVLPMHQEHSSFICTSFNTITIIKVFQCYTWSNWGTEVIQVLSNITQSQHLSCLKPPHLHSSKQGGWTQRKAWFSGHFLGVAHKIPLLSHWPQLSNKEYLVARDVGKCSLYF